MVKLETVFCIILCALLLQCSQCCGCSRKSEASTPSPPIEVPTTTTISEPEETVSQAAPILEKISNVSLINPASVTLRLFRLLGAEKVANSNPNDDDKSFFIAL
ncbi:hypothetical protein Fcan01_00317 [Folsomia candida]|uniref:Uncharacterized protein n=1 Tax=Folsomia candida TaxID=158441 RepID=A0A226F0I3_FOLCA|nr:hypothetical protein Fcan01_00317 [Folsomia candida]